MATLETTALYTHVAIRTLKEVHERTDPGANLGKLKTSREVPAKMGADELLSTLAAESDEERDWSPWRPRPRGGTLSLVQSLKAHVRKGRLVLDEPTDLPEGTEVSLTVTDDDELDDDERARLHESLRRSMAQAKAGQFIDADQVIGKLLARR
jgi:hypothetical protein